MIHISRASQSYEIQKAAKTSGQWGALTTQSECFAAANLVQPHPPPRTDLSSPSISTPSFISLGPVTPIGILRNFCHHVQKRPSPERPRGHRRRCFVENFSCTFQQAPTTRQHLACDYKLEESAILGQHGVRQQSLDLLPLPMVAVCAPCWLVARWSCRWRRRSLLLAFAKSSNTQLTCFSHTGPRCRSRRQLFPWLRRQGCPH